MCGKFTQMLTWAEVVEYADLIGGKEDDEESGGEGDQPEAVTPMRDARVIRLNEAGRREVVPMRWGWPERWAKGPATGRPKHMHARAETVDELRTFAPAFASRRGLVAVKTFNVGEEVGKKVIQHVVAPRDGKPLGIAVLWDETKDAAGAPLLAFVMVTTGPNAAIRPVTDRMPAIISPEHWGIWLGEAGATPEQAKALLMPYAGEMDIVLQEKPKGSNRPGSRTAPLF